MHFLILGRDRPGMLATRQATRPAHRDYIHGGGLPATLILGSPLADEAGEMNGTCLIVEAPDRAAAEAFAAGDPYAQAGIFEKVEILPFHAAFAGFLDELLARGR